MVRLRYLHGQKYINSTKTQRWIVSGPTRLLWLPVKRRPGVFAIRDNIVGLEMVLVVLRF